MHRADFTSRFICISGDGVGLAAIDWPTAMAAPDSSLPCSGGENRMLRLGGQGMPVNLRDA